MKRQPKAPKPRRQAIQAWSYPRSVRGALYHVDRPRDSGTRPRFGSSPGRGAPPCRSTGPARPNLTNRSARGDA